jgi:dynein intermediate chain 1
VSKKQGILNHIAFNKEEPLLIVGDSRGYVHSLKLSPNLRKRSKEEVKALQDEDLKEYRKLEVRKLEQLLTQVIEPAKGEAE